VPMHSTAISARRAGGGGGHSRPSSLLIASTAHPTPANQSTLGIDVSSPTNGAQPAGNNSQLQPGLQLRTGSSSSPSASSPVLVSPSPLPGQSPVDDMSPAAGDVGAAWPAPPSVGGQAHVLAAGGSSAANSGGASRTSTPSAPHNGAAAPAAPSNHFTFVPSHSPSSVPVSLAGGSGGGGDLISVDRPAPTPPSHTRPHPMATHQHASSALVEQQQMKRQQSQ
jgi:hypothetical protein